MDRALLSEIADIRASDDGLGATYGSPRVHQALRRKGIRVGKKRVERLMRSQQWQGAHRRKKFTTPTTVQDPTHPPAPDLVNRQFTTTRPNTLWVADVTEIPYGVRKFYLAAVRDAFSNKIVGWSTSVVNDTDLILRALEYAAWHRDYTQQDLIHHSDRGANYTSFEFGKHLRLNGILASMGSVGDSYDNALMENFWSTLKTELVVDNTWATQAEAENALFAYIDGFYNPTRIQKRLGWRSPDEYEAAYWNSNQPTQPDHDGGDARPPGAGPVPAPSSCPEGLSRLTGPGRPKAVAKRSKTLDP
jgi:transposase InsO family protein